MRFFSALTLSVLLSAPALAGAPIRSAPNFGLGLGGGTRTSGVSMKYWLNEGQAIQGTVGFWNDLDGRGDGIGLDADYLFEQPSLYVDDIVDIGWNAGPGAVLLLDDNFIGIGANGVVGIEFNFQPVPIDLVLEYRPALVIVSGNNVNDNLFLDLVDFSGHVRYYF